MAHARGGVVLALVCLGGIAWAGAPCEEGREQTGIAMAMIGGGLAVAVVDADSVAAASGVAAGDALVQVNDQLARSCADYARAVREARRGHKALLVLVRRADTEVPLALAAATWDRPVAIVSAPPPPPVEPPSVRTLVEKPRPTPLPPEASVSVAEVRDGLAGLAASAERPRSLAAYRDDVGRVARQVETLSARQAAPPDVVAGLDTVLAYYEAASVAWADAETQRERERRPRRLPQGESATASYFADSEAAAVIDRFPFLRPTVEHDPSGGALGVESAGKWRPLEARALLWAHGREELDRLSTWLAAGTS